MKNIAAYAVFTRAACLFGLQTQAADIARRSIAEMRRQGPIRAEDAAHWEAQMGALFPDVKTGDRLTGVHQPGQRVVFWGNGQRLGALADPVFAKLFFGLWLAPQTSQPALRRTLLGPLQTPTAGAAARRPELRAHGSAAGFCALPIACGHARPKRWRRHCTLSFLSNPRHGRTHHANTHFEVPCSFAPGTRRAGAVRVGGLAQWLQHTAGAGLRCANPGAGAARLFQRHA